MKALATPNLSKHAQWRGAQRGINGTDIELVLGYGRCVFLRNAWIHVVGRNEVRSAQETGIDLRPVEGVHVVLSPDGGVITVYRNRHLNLRPMRRRRPRRHTARSTK